MRFDVKWTILCLTCGTLLHVSRFDIQVSNYYKRHKHWFQEEDLDLVPENSAVVSPSLNSVPCCIIFTFLMNSISHVCISSLSSFIFCCIIYHIICHYYFRSSPCSEIHTIGKSLSLSLNTIFTFLNMYISCMYVISFFYNIYNT